MNIIDVSNPEWKLLGELVLGSPWEGLISTWLEEVLEPLGLPANLRARMLNSAQEAVTRIMQSNSAVMEVGHIHLLILVTRDDSSAGKTWGFFRIEKMYGVGNDLNLHSHSIELYLYVDV